MCFTMTRTRKEETDEPFRRFFPQKRRELPFASYGEYTDYLFSCVDLQLSAYIRNLMELFAREDGSFRNILYPDIDTAYSLCEKHLADFAARTGHQEMAEEKTAPEPEEDDGLTDLFASLAEPAPQPEPEPAPAIAELLAYVRSRAEKTDPAVTPLPLHALCEKLGMDDFTLFCFACAILSSTQTNYASIFQITNQNGLLAGAQRRIRRPRLFRQVGFAMTTAYGDMSLALETAAARCIDHADRTTPCRSRRRSPPTSGSSTSCFPPTPAAGRRNRITAFSPRMTRKDGTGSLHRQPRGFWMR